jgi:uncharacterized protein (TIGR00661 family)
MKRMLEEAGHSVVAVFMGENPGRPIPGFVREKLGSLLHTYPAPRFVVDRKGKGVRPWASLLRAVGQLPEYWRAFPGVHGVMRSARPDLIVNFYDLLGGLYKALYRSSVPVVAVAHQFLFFHPEHPVVRDKFWELQGVKWNTSLTALGADLRLALALSSLRDIPARKIRVVPPLLRRSVLEAAPRRGDHILAYVLNPGYAEELDQWHRRNPDVELHCFWDREDVPDTVTPRPGLILHRLSDEVFLDLLATCRGYTSTAGFESVCEAAFLGKPVMVVPTGNHLEQRCNALDAEKAGIAMWRTDFDLTEYAGRMDSFDPAARADFRAWVRQAQEMILPLLERTARGS